MEIQLLGLLEQEKQIEREYSEEYLPQHVLKNLLEISWSIQMGSRDHLPGKPEGQGKGHSMGKGESLPAFVFCSLDEAGSLSCSQTTSQAAAMTRSWTGLVPEQAPWLQAHHAGGY